MKALLHTGASIPPPADVKNEDSAAKSESEDDPAVFMAAGSDGGGGGGGGAPLNTKNKEVPLICVDIKDANGASYGGFRPSTKLLKLRDLIRKEPKDDKIM